MLQSFKSHEELAFNGLVLQLAAQRTLENKIYTILLKYNLDIV